MRDDIRYHYEGTYHEQRVTRKKTPLARQGTGLDAPAARHAHGPDDELRRMMAQLLAQQTRLGEDLAQLRDRGDKRDEVRLE